ncbi:hypothetical protein [Novosphingobium kaempferiae]|uniref:hypothetical protein n=1 Tax=Novosphingobium kaempferiae TaxID=2896849 RepID=UPI001E3D2652|nr:hypothetical protein [Novosphingobium kaempferiae]
MPQDLTGISRKQAQFIFAVSFLAPPLTIASLSLFFRSSPAIPQIIANPHFTEFSPQAFLSLSEKILNLSVGIFAGSTWIFTQKFKEIYKIVDFIIFIFSSILCIAGIYCGLRFMYEVSIQEYFSTFRMDLIENRIFLQGIFLILQACCLFCHAALLLINPSQRP